MTQQPIRLTTFYRGKDVVNLIPVPDPRTIPHIKIMQFMDGEQKLRNWEGDQLMPYVGESLKAINTISSLDGVRLPINDVEKTVQLLAALRGMLIDKIKSWKNDQIPPSHEFVFNGHTYRLFGDTMAKVFSGQPISAYEAIEVQELERVTQLWLPDKDGNFPQPGPDGKVVGLINFVNQYQLDVSSLAMIMRRPGEELPKTIEGLERWRVMRANELQLIPHQEVLNATFFLVRLYLQSIVKISTDTLSAALRKSRSARKQGKRWRRTQRGQQSRRKFQN